MKKVEKIIIKAKDPAYRNQMRQLSQYSRRNTHEFIAESVTAILAKSPCTRFIPNNLREIFENLIEEWRRKHD